MEFYEIEKISKNRVRLSDGTMLIRNTPIARTGVQLYGPDETPVKAENGRDPVMINRDPDEVFRPETVLSANGKALVDEHPDEDVSPKNWRDLAHGVVINPKRGEGADDDLLVADILVTSQDCINLIEDGKVELSCGYDAKYEKLGPNRGRQYDILINHVALVDSGRCGSRCAIGDKAMPKTKKVTTTWDRMLAAFGVKDESELKEKLEKETADEGEPDEGEEGEEHTHIHMHMGEGGAGDAAEPKFFKDFKSQYAKDLKTINDGLTKVTDSIKKLTKDEGEEGEGETKEEKEKEKEVEDEIAEELGEGMSDKAKAKDSAYLVESFSDVAAMAEIILPGISIPTLDGKATPKKTLDSICAFRRRVIDQAYGSDPATRDIVDEVLNGKALDSKMSCRQVRNLFRSVGAVKRRLNNSAQSRTQTTDFGGSANVAGPIKTIADLNKHNAEFYKNA